MAKNTARLRIISSLLVISALLRLQSVGNAAPCASGGAVRNNKELIEIALLSQTRLGFIGLPNDISAVKNYVREHPNCCSVSLKPRSFMQRLFSPGAYYEVHIIYKITPEAKVKFGGDYYEVFTVISDCGVVVEELGQQLSSRETPASKRYQD